MSKQDGFDETGDIDVQAQVARLAELGVLTSSLLHELRQPLFLLRGTAEMALAAGSPDAERWRGVLQQVACLESLVDRFGGLGRPGEPARCFDLDDPVRAAVQMLEHRARQLDAEIVPVLGGPLRILAEEAAIRQVVLNLLQNALDALEGQPVRRVEVRTAREADRVALVVEDTGPGIDARVVDRLFEPFVTSKAVGRGTGLGLYITRVLVARAGGIVQIASKPGDGTLVRVELPLARS